MGDQQPQQDPNQGVPSPFGLIYPSDLVANFGPTIVGTNVAMVVLAAIAVVLRIVARRFTKQRLLWDDWMIFIAFPLAIGQCIAACIAATHGLGRHIYTLTPAEIPVESEAFVATQIIWAATLPFVKTSILLLYVRIFGTLRWVRLSAWVLGAINFAYGIMVALVCALQCIPLEALWELTITDKKCINSGLFFILGSIPDFLTDIAILVLPFPAIWKLQTNRSQKIGLTGVFLLGSFTCVVSVIRFAELVIHGTNPDVTWALGNLGIWSTVEICVGIVAACLPTTWPLIVHVFPGLRNMTGTGRPIKPSGDGSYAQNLKNSKSRSKYSYPLSTVDSQHGGYDKMSDTDPLAKSTVFNDIRAVPVNSWDPTVPKDGIRVERNFTSSA